ncbi:MAG TPA: lysophospholipid acyltransferase family protein, partial [Burkholderiaceae bacterium]
MSVLFRLFSRCPLWLLHAVGAVLGWLTFLLSPTYRRRFLANARQASYGFSQVRAAVAHAGRMAGELPRLWLGAPLPVAWDEGGCIERAYAAGHGVVFLTPHMGCFEISAQAMARDYAPRFGPFTVLYRPPRKAWQARLMEGARNRPGLETAPTTLAGVRQMLRALRRGQAVGLLPDQVPPDGQGLWAPFFGRDAYTMTLAARLALQSGARVLLAWCERLPRARGFVVHVREMAGPLEGDAAQCTARINQAMEGLIRQCPAQYLWGYA